MDKAKNKKLIQLFLKNPGRIGSVAASSPFLGEKIAQKIDFSKARCIVEFGAGTGSITKKILKVMPPDCLLFCFEIEPELVKKMEKEIVDPRVKIISDSAEKIDLYLKKYNISKVDYIVSGLPLASLPKKTTRRVLQNAYAYLRAGGSYIQFQYSLITFRQIKYLFDHVTISFVPFNFPPAFVYVCVKS